MDNDNQIREVDSNCNALIGLISRKQNFISGYKWGEFTFEDASEEIELIFWLATELMPLSKSIIPRNILSKIADHLQRIRGYFHSIYHFSPSGGNVLTQRDTISQDLKNDIRAVADLVMPWMPISVLYTHKIEDWAGQMKKDHAEMTKLFQESKHYVAETKKEFEEVLRTSRDAAGEAAVAKFTKEFSNEARTIKNRNWCWFGITCLLSIAVFAISVMFMFGKFGEVPTNTWEALYGLGARVFGLSVLFYAAVWSGRIFLVNMHLVTVNKHRANSIQTLQAFLQAAKDPVAKNAVVIEAARAIYENVPSGYIGRQVAVQGSNAHLVSRVIKEGRRK